MTAFLQFHAREIGQYARRRASDLATALNKEECEKAGNGIVARLRSFFHGKLQKTAKAQILQETASFIEQHEGTPSRVEGVNRNIQHEIASGTPLVQQVWSNLGNRVRGIWASNGQKVEAQLMEQRAHGEEHVMVHATSGRFDDGLGRYGTAGERAHARNEAGLAEQPLLSMTSMKETLEKAQAVLALLHMQDTLLTNKRDTMFTEAFRHVAMLFRMIEEQERGVLRMHASQALRYPEELSQLASAARMARWKLQQVHTMYAPTESFEERWQKSLKLPLASSLEPSSGFLRAAETLAPWRLKHRKFFANDAKGFLPAFWKKFGEENMFVTPVLRKWVMDKIAGCQVEEIQAMLDLDDILRGRGRGALFIREGTMSRPDRVQAVEETYRTNIDPQYLYRLPAVAQMNLAAVSTHLSRANQAYPVLRQKILDSMLNGGISTLRGNAMTWQEYQTVDSFHQEYGNDVSLEGEDAELLQTLSTLQQQVIQARQPLALFLQHVSGAISENMWQYLLGALSNSSSWHMLPQPTPATPLEAFCLGLTQAPSQRFILFEETLMGLERRLKHRQSLAVTPDAWYLLDSPVYEQSSLHPIPPECLSLYKNRWTKMLGEFTKTCQTGTVENSSAVVLLREHIYFARKLLQEVAENPQARRELRQTLHELIRQGIPAVADQPLKLHAHLDLFLLLARHDREAFLCAKPLLRFYINKVPAPVAKQALVMQFEQLERIPTAAVS